MKKLKDFDIHYIKSVEDTYNELEKTNEYIKGNYRFDLSGTEISEAILERLKTYYITQGRIKTLLNKRYLAAASDFFVESVLFFLILYLQSENNNLEVHSERQIKRTKNAIRPDISIWKGEEVIAIIECKTQLGWNRHNWEEQFWMRDRKLKTEFPKAQSFLLVMTGLNWNGFENNTLLGEKYFCLLNDIWPTHFASSEQIITPIEKLFSQIVPSQTN